MSPDYPIGVHPRGCPDGERRGTTGVLEVTYRYDAAARDAIRGAFDGPGRRSMWRFAPLLPLTQGAEPVTLAEGGTPLLRADWLDGQSPARSALCSPQSDVIHRAMIAAYGAIAFVSASPDALLERLVHDEGWFPVTSMGAAGAANPYGVEGITTIAFELCEELGGLPDAVLVPASSGDQLYGVFKGFRELVELGLAERCPRMIGCQAAGAAPLAAAFREHLDEVPVLPNPTTVAASIGDATGSKPAVDAVRQSGGTFVTVADHEILRGQRSLAANGLLVEAASAATLAALTSRGCSDAFGQGERVVRLLTGSGAKWSAQLVSTTSGHIWLEPTPDELSAHLAADRSEARPPVDRRVPSC